MGMRGKRGKDRKSTGWIKDVVLGLCTAESVEKDWNAIGPSERIKTLSAWVPKEIKTDNNQTVRLILEGISVRPSLTARHIDALEQHDEQVHDNIEDQ